MKKDVKTMKRGEIINLFSLIRNIKNGNLSKEALIKYVMLRVKLKSVADEFEKAREEISEQTKPEDWVDGASTELWNLAFRPIMQKWLDEEVEIDTSIFTIEDCVDLINSNPDLPGNIGDVIMMFLNK